MSRPASDVEPILRQRFCARPECRAMFMICVSCDRGQRYCTPECRNIERLRQRREAQRRYQRSEQGREAHRCRQRRYRQRHAAPAVTDQGPHSITCSSSSPAVWPRRVVCKCHVCGRLSRWIDPFPPIPRRDDLQTGRNPPSTDVQISTFSMIANKVIGYASSVGSEELNQRGPAHAPPSPRPRGAQRRLDRELAVAGVDADDDGTLDRRRRTAAGGSSGAGCRWLRSRCPRGPGSPSSARNPPVRS